MKKIFLISLCLVFSQHYAMDDDYVALAQAQQNNCKTILRDFLSTLNPTLFNPAFKDKLQLAITEDNRTPVPYIVENGRLILLMYSGQERIAKYLSIIINLDEQEIVNQFNQKFSDLKLHELPPTEQPISLYFKTLKLIRSAPSTEYQLLTLPPSVPQFLERIYDNAKDQDTKKLASIFLAQAFSTNISYLQQNATKINPLLKHCNQFKELKIEDIKKILTEIENGREIEVNTKQLISILDSLNLTPSALESSKKAQKKQKPKKGKAPQKGKKGLKAVKKTGAAGGAAGAVTSDQETGAAGAAGAVTSEGDNGSGSWEMKTKILNLKYAPRINQWFDPKFYEGKKPSSIIYHRFPKKIDTYLIKYGVKKDYPNKTTPGQRDESSSLLGRVLFDTGEQKYVQYHLTRDPSGVIYHRGIEPRSFNEIKQSLEETGKELDVIQREEDNLLLLVDKIEPKKDQPIHATVTENELTVNVRDNTLGANFIIYKP